MEIKKKDKKETKQEIKKNRRMFALIRTWYYQILSESYFHHSIPRILFVLPMEEERVKFFTRYNISKVNS